MTSDEPIVLRLEVDRQAEPITGTLSEPGHAERSFTGWLALTEVIESIRAADRGSDGSSGAAEPHQPRGLA